MLTRFPLYNVSGSSSAFWHGEIDSGSCLEADTARPPTGRLRTCSCPPCKAATTATPGDYVFCLPSLVIIGMAKAGTEEMRGWLSSHPAMRVTTERETQFFNQLFGAAGGVPQRQQGKGKRAGARRGEPGRGAGPRDRRPRLRLAALRVALPGAPVGGWARAHV